ncbi:flagellar motor protein MotB [Roseococcus pinisoli]|uniref:OmpA family protein n=1 Tax=Roseococcus pinisoli TaxID=2835040 RepID=A0ABS5QBA3_9PROT|nr:flagellar motor protein MotB [Roseococcus pinisoli]MBS7810713.1 OmpA family protein [Roseococcus pinisoli]
MARRGNGGGIIVIRRSEEARPAHHGGAWKVAYADFVTAMMAFFLLMWLLNATTEAQRRGLADYFNPSATLSASTSGLGQPFGGRTPHSEGDMAADTGAIRLERGPRPTQSEEEDESETPDIPVRRLEGPPGEEEVAGRRVAEAAPGPAEGQRHAGSGTAERPVEVPRELGVASGPPVARLERPITEESRESAGEREQQALEGMVEKLRENFLADPALAALARQVLVEIAPEGLRIQLLEADGQPMFTTGGAVPTERARLMIRAVAQAAASLPNAVQVTGHTDSAPFRSGGRTNWDLSADRANAARRLLSEAGVDEARIRGVTGMADREPLLPGQPQAAGNRRVAITLLRQEAPR